jgi:serine/threonine protein kinase
MWSVGCILAELIGRRPLFAGADATSQLDLITEVTGTNKSEAFLSNIKMKWAVNYMKHAMDKDKKLFKVIFPDANPLACDLLDHLIVLNPADRLSVQEALEHPYLAKLHFEEDEPTSPPLSKLAFDFERKNYTNPESLRSLIIEEISMFHPSDSELAYVVEANVRKGSVDSLRKGSVEAIRSSVI